ncbi:hypothetical protein BJX76DRAFT_328432 [Aspergillus varians]
MGCVPLLQLLSFFCVSVLGWIGVFMSMIDCLSLVIPLERKKNMYMRSGSVDIRPAIFLFLTCFASHSV